LPRWEDDPGQYERGLQALLACRARLLDGYSCSFLPVDPTAARYAAWATVREGALCAVAGQAPSARALELRVHLPAVESMYQIRINTRTTTLSLTLDPDDEGWWRKQLAAKLPIPLSGACDPGRCARALGGPRTHTMRAAAAAIGTQGAAAHLTAYSLVCFPATRCDAGGPLRSPPLPLGEYSHLRGGRRSCGRLFAAPVPALVDADARTAAVTPSGLTPSKPAVISRPLMVNW